MAVPVSQTAGDYKKSQVFTPGASLRECAKHDASKSGLEQQRLGCLSLGQPFEVQNKFYLQLVEHKKSKIVQ